MINDKPHEAATNLIQVKNVHGDLLERAMRLRCVSYLADAKSKLLIRTVSTVGESKRSILSLNRQLERALRDVRMEIAAREEAESELRQTLEAIDRTPLMFALCDGGRINYANAAFADEFGAADALVGQPIDAVVGARLTQSGASALFAALHDGSAFQGEVRFLRPGGGFWGRVRHTPLPPGDDETLRVVLCIEDVTGEHEIEDRLQRSQRLEAIGQLTGGIAHDFNNLLGVICSNVELLLDSPMSADDRGLVGTIGDAARQGATLIHRLLAFARRQRLNPQSVDVDRMLAQVQALLSPSLGERYALERRVSGEPAVAVCDPVQLESAVVNLVLNARDASAPAGIIEIGTARVELDEARTWRGGGVGPGSYVELRVSDRGTGIRDRDLDRIWEPFVTTKPEGHGTGLGLSMVLGFAAQSEGAVWIESAVGEGTTVRLLLPRAGGDIGVAPAVEPYGEDPVRILLVDDAPLLRRSVHTLLERSGFSVVSVDSMQAAMEAASRRAFDVLVTDVVLRQRETGTAVAQAVRELHPDLRVLFVSGYAYESLDQEEMGHLDRFQFLSKPFTRAQLVDAIRELLESPARGATKRC